MGKEATSGDYLQMSRATPQIHEFAKRLIALEARSNSAKAKSPPAFSAIEKLRPHLATLMGNAGFRAILSRALALASAESSWLSTLHLSVDGSLQGSNEIAREADSRQVAEGTVALVSQLLGLLATFIGEDLTVHLVREVWPQLSVNDLDSANEGKNEKAK